MAKDEFDFGSMDDELDKLSAGDASESEFDGGGNKSITSTLIRGAKAFGSEFTQLSSFGDVAFHSAKEMAGKENAENVEQVYDKASEAIQKGTSDIKKAAAAVGKQVKSFIPNDWKIAELMQKVIDKLDNKADQYEEERENKEHAENMQVQQGILAALGNLTDKQHLDNLIQQEVQAKQQATTAQLLQHIQAEIKQVRVFTYATTDAFYRKSLELQYKSLYVQKEHLEFTKYTFNTYKNQFEAIVKNTGLPEIAKHRLFGHTLDKMVYKFKDDMMNRVVSNILPTNKFAENVGNYISRKANALVEGLTNTGDALDMIKENFGEDMGISKEQMAAMVAADQLKSYVGKKFGEKVVNKSEKLKKLQYWVGSIFRDPRILRDELSSGTNPVFGSSKLARHLGNIMYALAPNQVEHEATPALGKIAPDEPAVFDGRVHQSIVKIIPQLLAKIVNRLPEANDNSKELVWDNKTDSFVTKAAKIDALKKDFLKRNETVNDYFANILEKLLPSDDEGLTDEAKGLLQDSQNLNMLRQYLVKSVYDGSFSKDPERMLLNVEYKSDKFKTEEEKKRAEALDKILQGNKEYLLKKFRDDPDLVKNLSGSLEGIANALESNQSAVEDMHRAGYSKDLLDKYLTQNEYTGQYSYDRNKELEILLQHYNETAGSAEQIRDYSQRFKDLRKQKEESTLNRDAITEVFRDTGDWAKEKYRSGKSWLAQKGSTLWKKTDEVLSRTETYRKAKQLTNEYVEDFKDSEWYRRQMEAIDSLRDADGNLISGQNFDSVLDHGYQELKNAIVKNKDGKVDKVATLANLLDLGIQPSKKLLNEVKDLGYTVKEGKLSQDIATTRVGRGVKGLYNRVDVKRQEIHKKFMNNENYRRFIDVAQRGKANIGSLKDNLVKHFTDEDGNFTGQSLVGGGLAAYDATKKGLVGPDGNILTKKNAARLWGVSKYKADKAIKIMYAEAMGLATPSQQQWLESNIVHPAQTAGKNLHALGLKGAEAVKRQYRTEAEAVKEILGERGLIDNRDKTMDTSLNKGQVAEFLKLLASNPVQSIHTETKRLREFFYSGNRKLTTASLGNGIEKLFNEFANFYYHSDGKLLSKEDARLVRNWASKLGTFYINIVGKYSPTSKQGVAKRVQSMQKQTEQLYTNLASGKLGYTPSGHSPAVEKPRGVDLSRPMGYKVRKKHTTGTGPILLGEQPALTTPIASGLLGPDGRPLNPGPNDKILLGPDGKPVNFGNLDLNKKEDEDKFLKILDKNGQELGSKIHEWAEGHPKQLKELLSVVKKIDNREKRVYLSKLYTAWITGNVAEYQRLKFDLGAFENTTNYKYRSKGGTGEPSLEEIASMSKAIDDVSKEEIKKHSKDYWETYQARVGKDSGIKSLDLYGNIVDLDKYKEVVAKLIDNKFGELKAEIFEKYSKKLEDPKKAATIDRTIENSSAWAKEVVFNRVLGKVKMQRQFTEKVRVNVVKEVVAQIKRARTTIVRYLNGIDVQIKEGIQTGKEKLVKFGTEVGAKTKELSKLGMDKFKYGVEELIDVSNARRRIKSVMAIVKKTDEMLTENNIKYIPKDRKQRIDNQLSVYRNELRAIKKEVEAHQFDNYYNRIVKLDDAASGYRQETTSLIQEYKEVNAILAEDESKLNMLIQLVNSNKSTIEQCDPKLVADPISKLIEKFQIAVKTRRMKFERYGVDILNKDKAAKGGINFAEYEQTKKEIERLVDLAKNIALGRKIVNQLKTYQITIMTKLMREEPAVGEKMQRDTQKVVKAMDAVIGKISTELEQGKLDNFKNRVNYVDGLRTSTIFKIDQARSEIRKELSRQKRREIIGSIKAAPGKLFDKAKRDAIEKGRQAEALAIVGAGVAKYKVSTAVHDAYWSTRNTVKETWEDLTLNTKALAMRKATATKKAIHEIREDITERVERAKQTVEEKVDAIKEMLVAGFKGKIQYTKNVTTLIYENFKYSVYHNSTVNAILKSINATFKLADTIGTQAYNMISVLFTNSQPVINFIMEAEELTQREFTKQQDPYALDTPEGLTLYGMADALAISKANAKLANTIDFARLEPEYKKAGALAESVFNTSFTGKINDTASLKVLSSKPAMIMFLLKIVDLLHLGKVKVVAKVLGKWITSVTDTIHNLWSSLTSTLVSTGAKAIEKFQKSYGILIQKLGTVSTSFKNMWTKFKEVFKDKGYNKDITAIGGAKSTVDASKAAKVIAWEDKEETETYKRVLGFLPISKQTYEKFNIFHDAEKSAKAKKYKKTEWDDKVAIKTIEGNRTILYTQAQELFDANLLANTISKVLEQKANGAENFSTTISDKYGNVYKVYVKGEEPKSKEEIQKQMDEQFSLAKKIKEKLGGGGLTGATEKARQLSSDPFAAAQAAWKAIVASKQFLKDMKEGIDMDVLEKMYWEKFTGPDGQLLPHSPDFPTWLNQMKLKPKPFSLKRIVRQLRDWDKTIAGKLLKWGSLGLLAGTAGPGGLMMIPKVAGNLATMVGLNKSKKSMGISRAIGAVPRTIAAMAGNTLEHALPGMKIPFTNKRISLGHAVTMPAKLLTGTAGLAAEGYHRLGQPLVSGALSAPGWILDKLGRQKYRAWKEAKKKADWEREDQEENLEYWAGKTKKELENRAKKRIRDHEKASAKAEKNRQKMEEKNAKLAEDIALQDEINQEKTQNQLASKRDLLLANAKMGLRKTKNFFGRLFSSKEEKQRDDEARKQNEQILATMGSIAENTKATADMEKQREAARIKGLKDQEKQAKADAKKLAAQQKKSKLQAAKDKVFGLLDFRKSKREEEAKKAAEQGRRTIKQRLKKAASIGGVALLAMTALKMFGVSVTDVGKVIKAAGSVIGLAIKGVAKVGSFVTGFIDWVKHSWIGKMMGWGDDADTKEVVKKGPDGKPIQKIGPDGNPVVDKDGNPVYETERVSDKPGAVTNAVRTGVNTALAVGGTYLAYKGVKGTINAIRHPGRAITKTVVGTGKLALGAGKLGLKAVKATHVAPIKAAFKADLARVAASKIVAKETGKKAIAKSLMGKLKVLGSRLKMILSNSKMMSFVGKTVAGKIAKFVGKLALAATGVGAIVSLLFWGWDGMKIAYYKFKEGMSWMGAICKQMIGLDVSDDKTWKEIKNAGKADTPDDKRDSDSEGKDVEKTKNENEKQALEELKKPREGLLSKISNSIKNAFSSSKPTPPVVGSNQIGPKAAGVIAKQATGYDPSKNKFDTSNPPANKHKESTDSPFINPLKTGSGKRANLKDLHPDMKSRIEKFAEIYYARTGKQLPVTSGKRELEDQIRLWEAQAKVKWTGNKQRDYAAVRKAGGKYYGYNGGTVGYPNPGNRHVQGNAVDVNIAGTIWASKVSNKDTKLNPDLDGMLAAAGLYRPLHKAYGRTSELERWHVQSTNTPIPTQNEAPPVADTKDPAVGKEMKDEKTEVTKDKEAKKVVEKKVKHARAKEHRAKHEKHAKSVPATEIGSAAASVVNAPKGLSSTTTTKGGITRTTDTINTTGVKGTTVTTYAEMDKKEIAMRMKLDKEISKKVYSLDKPGDARLNGLVKALGYPSRYDLIRDIQRKTGDEFYSAIDVLSAYDREADGMVPRVGEGPVGNDRRIIDKYNEHILSFYGNKINALNATASGESPGKKETKYGDKKKSSGPVAFDNQERKFNAPVPVKQNSMVKQVAYTETRDEPTPTSFDSGSLVSILTKTLEVETRQLVVQTEMVNEIKELKEFMTTGQIKDKKTSDKKVDMPDIRKLMAPGPTQLPSGAINTYRNDSKFISQGPRTYDI